MGRLFHILFLLLVSSLATAASPTAQLASDSDSGKQSLQEILKHIDEAKVHDALHLLSTKFRHGVFPTDTNALEALHKEDASVGRRLLKIAKRQGPENSTSSSTPPPSTTSVPSTSQVPTSPTGTTVTVTETAPTETVPTTTAQNTPPPDTTPPSTPPPTTSSVKPPTTAPSPPSTASTTHSQAPSTFSTSSTKTPETTAATTQHTNNEPFTSTYRSTTTLPNGSLSTITDIRVVHPTPTGSTSGKPGLQNGGSALTALTKEIVAIMGGAVLVAIVL